MRRPHVLAIPYPAQGHVIPLMEVAQCLANGGIRVTFVNTELNHSQMVKAQPSERSIHELITLASIPNGTESWEERNDHGKVAEATVMIMPSKLESLIQKINATESDEIICVLCDFYMGKAMEVAEKMGMKKAVFFPASFGVMALTMNAQELVDIGIIDGDGTPLKTEMVQLSPSILEISTADFPWVRLPDSNTRKMLFHRIIENNKVVKHAEWLICNSSYNLEPGALTFTPHCAPIGPLLARNRSGNPTGHFWTEDPDCIEWLDRQAPGSVIYVAFGSFTIFDEAQFQELALGLELTNRPLLWVVRDDLIVDVEKAFPNGFRERVGNRGKMVSWAPQQRVLSHESVACFLSHCGWNSTMEGISNGVPFLCWPYFADQFINQSYICDHWKVGLGLEKDDEDGIIRREEIVNKVELLLSDESCYKRMALELGEKIMAGVRDGGDSQKNFVKFMDWIKENVSG